MNFRSKKIVLFLSELFNLKPNIFNKFILKFTKIGFSKFDAITPANGFVYDLIEYLKKNNCEIPIVIDDNTKKDFNTKIISINSIISNNINKIYIASPKYNHILEKKLKNILKGNKKIINTYDFILNFNEKNTFSPNEFLKLIKLFSRKINVDKYEDKTFLLVIKFKSSDMEKRVKKISMDLNAKVKYFDITNTNELIRLSKFIIKNRKKNKIYLFLTAVYTNYLLSVILKQIFKNNIKIILYVYDYLPFMIKHFGKENICKLSGLSLDAIEEENKAALYINSNYIVDFLIYKDKGLDLFKSTNNRTKRFFWPVLYLQEKYNIPKKYLNNRDFSKLLYIGNLNFLEDCNLLRIFKKFLDADFRIDVYFNGDLDSLYEYKNRLNSNRFNVKKGLPISQLIPELVTKGYSWGLCLVSESISVDERDMHISYAIPSKIATYISLRVPIIISEQLKYCAKLVEKYDIGIIMKKDTSIIELKQKMEHFNIEKFLINIQQLEKFLDTNAKKINFNGTI